MSKITFKFRREERQQSPALRKVAYMPEDLLRRYQEKSRAHRKSIHHFQKKLEERNLRIKVLEHELRLARSGVTSIDQAKAAAA